MGLGYGVGNLGKIIGPLGLALIIGSSNYVSPKATLDAIVPAFLFLAFWYALAALAFWLVGFETKGRSIEEIGSTLDEPPTACRFGRRQRSHDGRRRRAPGLSAPPPRSAGRLAAELEDICGLLGPVALAIEPAGHRLDIGRGGARPSRIGARIIQGRRLGRRPRPGRGSQRRQPPGSGSGIGGSAVENSALGSSCGRRARHGVAIS